MLASGVVELLSLGAVVPFIGVLSNPQRLWQQPIVQEVSIKFVLMSIKIRNNFLLKLVKVIGPYQDRVRIIVCV